MPKRFAITGVAGYVAPRHLKAIIDTGNNLVAALDPNDSVGILDSYAPEVKFFTEFERFDRHLEKLRRKGDDFRIDYLSICSPNYLHDAHIRLALRLHADAICEKPLVLNPWNLDALHELETETGNKVYTILQLREHPTIKDLKKKIESETQRDKHDITLTYITSRGEWYLRSWKGGIEKSGGLATNIGVHFYDMLIWIFGKVEKYEIHIAQPKKIAGYFELDNAKVKWFLSVDKNDLPSKCKENDNPAFRSIIIDGQEIEFSTGFTDLHTVVYRETLAGNGFGIEDSRPSIKLIHDIRVAETLGVNANSHPLLI